MNWIDAICGLELKLSRKCKYFLLFLICLLQGAVAPSLHAGTTYSTFILDKENDSVFLDAIKSNDLKAVKQLISAGHDVNKGNSYGTPLMAAVCKGNVKMVRLFIASGAELEAFDNQGNTPLMYAFYDAIEKTDVVRFLLSLNANVKIMNSQEQTPLMLATLNNHFNSMQLLIDCGVNLETRGKSGMTALLHSVDNQRIEAAKLLIKYGANIEARDDWGFAPLMLAAFQNDGSMIRVLIKAGADVNARTTKVIPVSLKKDFWDFRPQTVNIPVGSTALDIARQFEKRFAENVLVNEAKAQ